MDEISQHIKDIGNSCTHSKIMNTSILVHATYIYTRELQNTSTCYIHTQSLPYLANRSCTNEHQPHPLIINKIERFETTRKIIIVVYKTKKVNIQFSSRFRYCSTWCSSTLCLLLSVSNSVLQSSTNTGTSLWTWVGGLQTGQGWGLQL